MNSHFAEPPRRRYMLVQHCPRSGRRHEWTMVPRSGEGSDVDHGHWYMGMVQQPVLVRHNADTACGAWRARRHSVQWPREPPQAGPFRDGHQSGPSSATSDRAGSSRRTPRHGTTHLTTINRSLERPDQPQTNLSLADPGRAFHGVTPPVVAPAAIRARRHGSDHPAGVEPEPDLLSFGHEASTTAERPCPARTAAELTGLGVEHVHADGRRDEGPDVAITPHREVITPTDLDVVVREPAQLAFRTDGGVETQVRVLAEIDQLHGGRPGRRKTEDGAPAEGVFFLDVPGGNRGEGIGT